MVGDSEIIKRSKQAEAQLVAYKDTLESAKLFEDQGWFWDDEDKPSGTENALSDADATNLSADFHFTHNRFMNVLISADHGDFLGAKYEGPRITDQAKFWLEKAKELGHKDLVLGLTQLKDIDELDQDDGLSKERVNAKDFKGLGEYWPGKKAAAINSFLSFYDQNQSKFDALFKDAAKDAQDKTDSNIKAFKALHKNLTAIKLVNEAIIPFRALQARKDELCTFLTNYSADIPFLQNGDDISEGFDSPLFVAALMELPESAQEDFETLSGMSRDQVLKIVSDLTPAAQGQPRDYDLPYLAVFDAKLEELKKLTAEDAPNMAFLGGKAYFMEPEHPVMLLAGLSHLSDDAKTKFKEITGLDYFNTMNAVKQSLPQEMLDAVLHVREGNIPPELLMREPIVAITGEDAYMKMDFERKNEVEALFILKNRLNDYAGKMQKPFLQKADVTLLPKGKTPPELESAFIAQLVGISEHAEDILKPGLKYKLQNGVELDQDRAVLEVCGVDLSGLTDALEKDPFNPDIYEALYILEEALNDENEEEYLNEIKTSHPELTQNDLEKIKEQRLGLHEKICDLLLIYEGFDMLSPRQQEMISKKVQSIRNDANASFKFNRVSQNANGIPDGGYNYEYVAFPESDGRKAGRAYFQQEVYASLGKGVDGALFGHTGKTLSDNFVAKEAKEILLRKASEEGIDPDKLDEMIAKCRNGNADTLGHAVDVDLALKGAVAELDEPTIQDINEGSIPHLLAMGDIYEMDKPGKGVHEYTHSDGRVAYYSMVEKGSVPYQIIQERRAFKLLEQELKDMKGPSSDAKVGAVDEKRKAGKDAIAEITNNPNVREDVLTPEAGVTLSTSKPS
ncbi:MAG: hypothetical protein KDJ35_06675 [Alphaproteobacteria bacterium]|nr:hypothetical protein [Alphaproteobacteria bacterium]